MCLLTCHISLLSAQNLSHLTTLNVLSVQSNRLTRIAGLEALVNLQELYLSHNGIEVIEGIATLVWLGNALMMERFRTENRLISTRWISAATKLPASKASKHCSCWRSFGYAATFHASVGADGSAVQQQRCGGLEGGRRAVALSAPHVRVPRAQPHRRRRHVPQEAHARAASSQAD